MHELLFLQMWAYGMITMISSSYLNYHIMDSWVLRHDFKCRCFGIFVASVEVIGLTLFAYASASFLSMGEVMAVTSLYFVGVAVAAAAIHRLFHIKDLP